MAVRLGTTAPPTAHMVRLSLRGDAAQKSIHTSNLDHVFAADHLKFKKFSGAEVEVSGWVDEATTAAKKDWIAKHLDHCMLYGEIVS